MSHGLAYVLAGVLLAVLARDGRAVLVWSWLHVPVAAFLVANVLATVFAVDLLLALYGAHTRMGGLGTVADGVVLYTAIALLVRTRSETYALAASFLAGSIVVLLYELIQFVGRDPLSWAIDSAIRPFSTIGQTTNLAEYLTVVTIGAAAFALLQRQLSLPARAALALYSVLVIAGTAVTQTRSSIFGLVSGGAVLFMATWRVFPSRRARSIALGGTVCVAGGLAAVLIATPLGTRLLSTVDLAIAADDDRGIRLEESTAGRLALYRIALDMLRDRPALGHGPDNFSASLPRYRSENEPYGVQDNPTTSAHSWVAQVAATTGVAGLVAFAATFLVAGAVTIRSGFRPESAGALAILAAFLGGGLTTVHAVSTGWIFWAATGLIAATTVNTAGLSRRRPSRQASSGVTSPRSLCALASVGVGVVLALTTFNAIEASRSAKSSQVERLRGQSQLAVDYGLRATRLDPQRPQYWNTLGLAYVSSGRLAEAVSTFERASKLAPYDVRYDGDLARAFAAQVLRGDSTAVARAREVANRAIRTDPNNPLAHHTKAVVMQVTGDATEALKASERALALDRISDVGHTHNREIYITGAQVLNTLGRSVEAAAVARTGIARLGDEGARVPLRIELSRSLLATGQAKDALTEIDAVLLVRPNDQVARQLRSQILAALANP